MDILVQENVLEEASALRWLGRDKDDKVTASPQTRTSKQNRLITLCRCCGKSLTSLAIARFVCSLEAPSAQAFPSIVCTGVDPWRRSPGGVEVSVTVRTLDAAP